MPELAGPKVDVGNRVTTFAVAGGTLSRKDLRAILNVGRSILDCTILSLCVRPHEHQENPHNGALQQPSLRYLRAFQGICPHLMEVPVSA